MERSDLNNGSFEAASVTPEDIKAAPVDQTKRRPDTHPELRSGLWQFAQASEGSENFSRVIETTVVEADEPGEAADTTALLPYNPEVINVAQAREGDEIIEAAAAGRADAEADANIDADAEIRTNVDADKNDASIEIKTDADVDGTAVDESSGAQSQDDLNRLRGNERNRLDTDPNRE